MTTEQREAIEFLEFYKQHCLKKEIENMDNYETIHDGDFVSKNLDIVLSLIKEQNKKIEDREKSLHDEILENYDKQELLNKQLKQKDKQIDLMAELIGQDMMCIRPEIECNKMTHDCKDCIKQYFERKAENEE